MKLQETFAKSRCRCACCGESIRKCETVHSVVRADGTAIRGEKYCDDPNCLDAAVENNPELQERFEDFMDEEQGLRAREQYAAYQAAGATAAYWEDRDAGY